MGGRVEVSTPSNPRLMSQGLWAPLLGLRADWGLSGRNMEFGALTGPRAFWRGLRGYMELVVWSLGFPRASGAWVLQQSEDKWVDTWIPKRRMGLWMLGSMEGIVRGCHF